MGFGSRKFANLGTITLGLVLALVLVFSVVGCKTPDLDVPQLTYPAKVSFDQLGTYPAPFKKVDQSQINKVFNEAYPPTIYDKFQRIEKDVATPCHTDTTYKVCMGKNKVDVYKLKSAQVLKSINFENTTHFTDMMIGSSFFTVIVTEKDLNVFYSKLEVGQQGQKAFTKIVKRTYPLDKLDFGDKKVTVAVKKQAIPGFALWFVAVENEELKTPLYEIEFEGSGEKTPYVYRLLPPGVEPPAENPMDMMKAPELPAVPETPAVPDKPKVPGF